MIIAGAILIGLTLGLLGSGGSILTVPVLTYLLGHPSKAAIAESLAIVGGIAFFTVLQYARSKEVDWRTAVGFGIPGMAGTYLGAWLAQYVPGSAQLILFGCVVMLAAVTMLRSRPSSNSTEPHPIRRFSWKIIAEGLAVGVLTGLVGVGGGFLIVPALVILVGLPMRIAVGTSLVVIAVNSLSGFVKYVDSLRDLNLSVDWWTVGVFIAIGIVGSMTGRYLGQRLNQTMLRRIFAMLLVVVSVAVLGKEISQWM